MKQLCLALVFLLSSCNVKVSDDVKHFERRAFAASRDANGLLLLRMPIEGWNKVKDGPYEMNVVGEWKGKRCGFDLVWGEGRVDWVAKLIYSKDFVDTLAAELGQPRRNQKPLDRIQLSSQIGDGPPEALDLPGFRMKVDLNAGWVEWHEKDVTLRPAWVDSFY